MATMRRFDLNRIARLMAGVLCCAVLLAGAEALRPVFRNSAPVALVAPRNISSGEGLAQDQRHAGQFLEQNTAILAPAGVTARVETVPSSRSLYLEQNFNLPASTISPVTIGTVPSSRALYLEQNLYLPARADILPGNGMNQNH
jgi:hypothetical protein